MEIIDRIGQILTSHPIVLFMKGTASKPMCQDSHEAIKLLNACGVEYQCVDIQSDPEIRAYLPKYSDSPTFPQLFLQGELIGSTAILRELHEQGELCAMLERSRPACALAC